MYKYNAHKGYKCIHAIQKETLGVIGYFNNRTKSGNRIVVLKQ